MDESNMWSIRLKKSWFILIWPLVIQDLYILMKSKVTELSGRWTCSPSHVPATQFSAQTIFVEALPILMWVIYRNLLSGFNSFRDQDNTFSSQPVKFLELTIRCAGMVNKARVVTYWNKSVRHTRDGSRQRWTDPFVLGIFGIDFWCFYFALHLYLPFPW